MLGPDAPSSYEIVAAGGSPNATRVLAQLLFTVGSLLCVSVAVSLLIRRDGLPRPGWLAILGYFACLGLCFIVIEVGLL